MLRSECGVHLQEDDPPFSRHMRLPAQGWCQQALEGRELAGHLSWLKGPHKPSEWGQDHIHLRPGHLAALLLPMT